MDLNSIQEVKPHLVLMKISKIQIFYATNNWFIGGAK